MRSRVQSSLFLAALVAALAIGSFGALAKVEPLYAIRGARIMTMAGPAIDKGTVIMRNGIIQDVGATVTVPADAIVIEGAGLIVYPGLIDMANSAVLEPAETATAAPAAARGAAAGRGQAAAAPETTEDLQRDRRLNILRPDLDVARSVRFEGAEMQRLAAAGITSVLAVPASGLVRGQSALINVMAPADDPQISNIADYRRGIVVVKSPVAEHFAFNAGGGAGGGGGGGGAYPGSLLGLIAFVRQSLYDAQWQRDARAFSERHKDQPRPVMEPGLDALAPVLDGKLPAAFDANLAVEIDRALAMAKEFTLDPIIVGGAESAERTADLKAANARVIYSLNFPTVAGAGRGGAGAAAGGGRGGPAEETLRAMRARQDAPKGPLALFKAGVPFAFTSGGLQNPADFGRNAARTVKDGGLIAEAALQALTSGAAKIAGVADRLGTIEKGKIANIIAVDGDLLTDGTRIRHVFVDGRPVDLDVAPPTPAAGRGRGSRN